MNRKVKHFRNELTIDFGPFCQPKLLPKESLFQRVKSEMLKRKQKLAHRRKPLEYEKLQVSLQKKLKQKNLSKQEERSQLAMLQKCKNYFQLRRPRARYMTPKLSRHDSAKKPHPSSNSIYASSVFLGQLQGVMEECESESEQKETKENMHLFSFYCKMLDRRLEGIRNAIEKKQRIA